MSIQEHHQVSRFRRRGVVALQVGVMLTVLLGCAALTIDVGQLFSARTDLQKAADSATEPLNN